MPVWALVTQSVARHVAKQPAARIAREVCEEQ
jgi:hypothetical protein